MCYNKVVTLFELEVCGPKVLSLVFLPPAVSPRVFLPAWLCCILTNPPPLFFLAHPVLPPVSAVSPLKVEEFSKELASHPDQQQVSYVLQGLQHGFRLGFHSAHKLKPAKRNKPSALHHAHIVDAYLANEVSLGRVAGPFSPLPVSSFAYKQFWGHS